MLPAKVGAVQHARALHELGQPWRYIANRHDRALAGGEPNLITLHIGLYLVTMITDHVPK